MSGERISFSWLCEVTGRAEVVGAVACPCRGCRGAALEAENARLRIALHDAIRRPMGVTPDSAVEFYDQRMADEAEERRPRWSDRAPPAPPGILIAADQDRPAIPADRTRIAKPRRARPDTVTTDGEGV